MKKKVIFINYELLKANQDALVELKEQGAIIIAISTEDSEAIVKEGVAKAAYPDLMAAINDVSTKVQIDDNKSRIYGVDEMYRGFIPKYEDFVQ